MKYSLLLAVLLGTSSLVAQGPQTIGDFDKINSTVEQVSNVEDELALIRSEMSTVSELNARLASMKSEMRTMKEVNQRDSRTANAKAMADEEKILGQDADVRISVLGQGVAPMNTSSPAQAYALAKRAATADAYRLIAEKVKGVRIEGQDLIKDMMVKRSTVRSSVQALVRNANIVETTFKEGLCEVEMEIVLSHAQFSR